MSDVIEINIEYHPKQAEIFFDEYKRFKVVSKGRRFGLTRGMIHYAVERGMRKSESILWVDTTYSNIQRYIERYLLPILKQYPSNLWGWSKTKNEISITANGYSIIDFRSADRPENIEGFGYSLIILNEAGIILKNERLWLESIRPMMLDYEAEAIIGGTPKGKKSKKGEHLFYKLYNKGLSSGEKKWKSYNYSSYDNVLLKDDEIKELETELPEYLVRQEIYGEFIEEAEAEIIKERWWIKVEKDEWKRERVLGKYQSWDTAFKKNEENDYSVCTTWVATESSYYLIDIVRKRYEFPELKAKVVEEYEKHKPNYVLIEDKASGQSLIQELERNTRIPIKKIKVDKDKISRVNSVTPLFESGKVKIVLKPTERNRLMEMEKVQNLEYAIKECSEFPGGEFDDAVDSITQLLNYAKRNVREERPIVHIKRGTKVNRKKG